MTNPQSNPRPSGQGATILLLGFLILLISCVLILTVRVHARLGALTEELIKLNAKVAPKEKDKAKDNADAPVTPSPALKTNHPEDNETQPVVIPKVVSGSVPVGTMRSPIPQPGEVFPKPLIPAQLAEKEPVKPIAEAPAEGEIIPWDKAQLHMGRTITVEGKIVTTKRLASICFLNFTTDANGGDAFYLVVFKDQFGDWGGSPEQAFLNKTVRVTGTIEDHKGRPQMKINQKDQVLKLE